MTLWTELRLGRSHRAKDLVMLYFVDLGHRRQCQFTNKGSVYPSYRAGFERPKVFK